MEYLLYLSGCDSGRTVGLKKKDRQMTITRRGVGGGGAEDSYYAREGCTYEMKWLGGCNGCHKEFGIDVPKSIETESFPSSVGTV